MTRYRRKVENTRPFEPVTLVIHGKPTSKKTNARHITVRGISRQIPSAAYVAYEESALLQLATQWKRSPIEQPCHVSVRFYRDNRTDVDNMAGGLLDILQAAKVIANDRLVYSLFATKSGKCDGDPRAEVFITPYVVTTPGEALRAVGAEAP